MKSLEDSFYNVLEELFPISNGRYNVGNYAFAFLLQNFPGLDAEDFAVVYNRLDVFLDGTRDYIEWIAKERPAFFITHDVSLIESDEMPRVGGYRHILAKAIACEVLNDFIGEDVCYVYIEHGHRHFVNGSAVSFDYGEIRPC